MSDLEFRLDGLSVLHLTRNHLPELQAFFERCGDYVELLTGAPPSEREAEEAMAGLPVGKAQEDKVCLGFVDDEGTLVGYLDLVRDYPVAGDWWLGLLMLDPAVRSRGLGRRIHGEAVRWVGSEGGRTIWIGVLEANPAAERFWRRAGYEEVRRQPFTSDGGMAHTMIVLRCGLSGAS